MGGIWDNGMKWGEWGRNGRPQKRTVHGQVMPLPYSMALTVGGNIRPGMPKTQVKGWGVCLGEGRVANTTSGATGQKPNSTACRDAVRHFPLGHPAHLPKPLELKS